MDESKNVVLIPLRIYSILLWEKGKIRLDSNAIIHIYFAMPKLYVTSLQHPLYFYHNMQFQKLFERQIQVLLKTIALKK